jgi:hypothetical protein
MTERRHSYPTVNGSLTVTSGGRRFVLLFKDRLLELKGSDDSIRAVSTKFTGAHGGLRAIRKVSSYLSRMGFTVKIEDDHGSLISMGSGVWTPLGHFNAKARIRKYRKID